MKETKRIYLDRNENLYGPAPKCYHALKNVSLEDLSVYSRDFTRGVKSKLSERLAGELNIPEQQILLSEGSEDMLKQAVHCYLGPGERILCPSQSWWYYRSVASEVGGETITYRLKEQNDRYAYDVEEMISLYQRESPRVVLIASPNNPTGNSFPDDDLNRLTEAFRESIVILDEAYWGFSEPRNEHIAALIERYRNILVLRTFSKYFALAGARIAFAAAGSSLARLTKFASRYLGYNRISEVLALAALDSTEYYHDMNAKLVGDRKRYYAFFDTLDGYRCFRSNANFVLVRIPPDTKEALHSFFADKDIAIKFFDDPEFQQCIRITIGRPEHNDRFFQLMKEFLAATA